MAPRVAESVLSPRFYPRRYRGRQVKEKRGVLGFERGIATGSETLGRADESGSYRSCSPPAVP
ncbi:hypothetical protein GCM10010121_043100 [Streptomyces brasiliensis]|uniref:Uncharacterized protein n=1 Tax=Streptomyces brasiliensis TaxID=1954 RepID=A0A917KSF0_9ACTN|nr:hypothetical protein GCM10010121_043100 [Streptomyces brasiliensis]